MSRIMRSLKRRLKTRLISLNNRVMRIGRLNISVILAWVVAWGLTASCGSARSTVSPAGSAEELNGPARGLLVDNDAVNALLSTYNGDWSDFQVPVSLSLESPQTMSVGGRLSVVRGMGMNLSIRVLGFEAAAITIVGDSIFAYEKLNKRAVAEDIRAVAQQAGVTCDDLCALLMGHLFVPRGEAACRVEGSKVYVYPRKEIPNVDFGWEVDVNRNGVAVPVACMLKSGGRGGELRYSNYVAGPAGAVASDMTLNVVIGKTQLRGIMEVNYNKAKWNGGCRVERPALRGYRLVKIEELMGMFKSL